MGGTRVETSALRCAEGVCDVSSGIQILTSEVVVADIHAEEVVSATTPSRPPKVNRDGRCVELKPVLGSGFNSVEMVGNEFVVVMVDAPAPCDGPPFRDVRRAKGNRVAQLPLKRKCDGLRSRRFRTVSSQVMLCRWTMPRLCVCLCLVLSLCERIQ